MSTFQPRKPAGRPDGGQFTTAARSASGIDLGQGQDAHGQDFIASLVHEGENGWGRAYGKDRSTGEYRVLAVPNDDIDGETVTLSRSVDVTSIEADYDSEKWRVDRAERHYTRPVHNVEYDLENLNDFEYEGIQQELEVVYTCTSGVKRSLRDKLNRQGVSGKTRFVQGNRIIHAVKTPDGFVADEISPGLYDAMKVKDVTGPWMQAKVEVVDAEHGVLRAEYYVAHSTNAARKEHWRKELETQTERLNNAKTRLQEIERNRQEALSRIEDEYHERLAAEIAAHGLSYTREPKREVPKYVDLEELLDL